MDSPSEQHRAGMRPVDGHRGKPTEARVEFPGASDE